jgi:hypothetical protein
MTTVITKATLVLAAVLALAGCENPNVPLGGDFGNAYRHNMAVQVVPQVPETGRSPQAMDGRRAGEAIERYRAGKVIQPAPYTTGAPLGGAE